MTRKIKIALVDDFNLMRTALADYINGVDEFEVIFQAETEEEFCSKMSWEIKPDVILMDYNLGDKNGTDCIKHVRDKYGEEIHILGLSMYKDLYVIGDMLNAGANGFLFKGCSTEEIIEAIREVHKNGFSVNKYTAKLVFGKRTGEDMVLFEQLNETEIGIIKHICLQETNETIAGNLNLSTHTVNSYRKKILKKLNCRNTAGLVLFAVKNGIHHI